MGKQRLPQPRYLLGWRHREQTDKPKFERNRMVGSIIFTYTFLKDYGGSGQRLLIPAQKVGENHGR